MRAVTLRRSSWAISCWRALATTVAKLRGRLSGLRDTLTARGVMAMNGSAAAQWTFWLGLMIIVFMMFG